MSTTPNDLGETSKGNAPDASANGGPAQTAKAVAGNVGNVANEAVARLPEATQATRQAVEDANRAIQSGSDEALMAGTTLSVGLALGLLLGGANRLLVILALIPAAAMGFTLLDRSQSGRGSAPVKRG
ncbi:MAG TPA: hypothetical protein VFU17_00905 [Candidatus Limnocylindrales bacterium]|nr:hypothetical protein [Candidatus Limnocylindrales bacterium]